MRRRLAGCAVIASLVTSMSGCATKPIVYGPIGEGQPWGYSGDKVNPDGGHTVLFIMPGGTTAPAMRELWNRRAGEVCPAGVERTNIFRVDHPSYTQQGYAYQSAAPNYRVYTSAQVEGYVYCKAEAAKAD